MKKMENRENLGVVSLGIDSVRAIKLSDRVYGRVRSLNHLNPNRCLNGDIIYRF